MDYNRLLQTPVFKGLSIEEITGLLSYSHYQIKKIRAGSVVALSGEQVNSLIIVMNGIVKGEMTDFAGRVIKIEDIPAPGTLASAFLFGTNNRYPVNVVADTDVELLIIGKNDLLKILKENQKTLVNFLDLVSNRSQFLSEKIRFLNFKTIKVKLAQYILQLSGEKCNSVRMKMTHNELSLFFGVARPSVSRALKELEHDGYIQVARKEIRILDRNMLLSMTRF